MIDIAAEAGLSLGGLYRYFGNKEDVFRELVATIHEELFNASVSGNHVFAEDPYGALFEANRSFLDHYVANHDILRVFVEAAAVDEELRLVWWTMRHRHIERFIHRLTVSGLSYATDASDLHSVTEALACMVEQCAYVWYAQAPVDRPVKPLDDAARVVTDVWYRSIFGNDGRDVPAQR